jgi:hypothetical protein
VYRRSLAETLKHCKNAAQSETLPDRNGLNITHVSGSPNRGRCPHSLSMPELTYKNQPPTRKENGRVKVEIFKTENIMTCGLEGKRKLNQQLVKHRRNNSSPVQTKDKNSYDNSCKRCA